MTATARAAKAALRYAGKQHRERADMIVNTELAFAYNRGADIGIKRAIRDGFMGRCEMVWTTAGTNRVCQRCLALKDKVVGHTDEDGVTLPPLHPRCRCAIMYREVRTTNNPAKQSPNRNEPNKLRGIPKLFPPSPLDSFVFDLQRFGDDGKITLNINGFGEAHIPMAKLTKYALNPEKAPDKALAFEKALGYNLSNIDKLIENVVQNINNFEPVRRPKTEHGEPFQVVMELVGENGKSAKVTTGWIIDATTKEVRLTSIYVKKK